MTETKNEKREANEARKQSFARAVGMKGSSDAKKKAWREYDDACDLCDLLEREARK